MRKAITPPDLTEAARQTGFSPAIRAGDFLYLTGATGGGPEGMPQDIASQARNALVKAVKVLQAAGASANDVVEMTTYHRDIDATFGPVEDEVQRVFASPLPAWTAVEVAKLRRPGALIEFRIVAHHPESAPE